MAGCQDGGFCLAAVFVAEWVFEFRIVREGVVESHEHLTGAVEGSIYHVHVVDLGAAEEQGQADVPVGLFAGAKDGEVVDFVAAFEEHAAG